ncbi:MAG: DUF2207 domain-containing protein [Eubacterium sp.]|jgi:Predicted membrane protein|nr:DUF2207 domain-containing protein [Eubacterium sp.]
MKRLIQIFVFSLLIAFSTAPSVNAGVGDFTIEGYHVDIKVTAQNTYRIQETIKVNFPGQRHGIYRDIPLVNTVQRKDGSSDRIVARIENIRCEEKYSISREGDSCRIQIGDKDVRITGDKEYRISYDYVMGNDVLKEKDEFYFNVIGMNWETIIKNVTFSIEMPKEFDVGQLGMSWGRYGSDQYEGLFYTLEGNTIHGQLSHDIILRAGQGVTVRILLPEGYFERAETVPWAAFGAIFYSFLAMGLALLLWYLYGRDDPVVETVEFHAPDGLNSVDLAFTYHGMLSTTDVTSLIVYLAQKGYIEIQEGTDRRKKEFTLVRKKPYDGTDPVERVFMEGLFRSGNTVGRKDLENKFYKTVNQIVSMVDNKKNRQKIFYANSINKGWILWILALAGFLLAGFLPVYRYEYSFLYGIAASGGIGFLFTLAFSALFTPGKMVGRIALFVILFVPGIITGVMFLYEPLLFAGVWYPVSYVLAIAASGVIMFFGAYMSKRTEYGSVMLGRIQGFKNFLEMAEKERLEAMVAENPQYFYEILPYTYVLGISDKWMKKFESIAVEPPTWYESSSHSTFNVIMFHSFMRSTMTSASSAMVSSPNSSGGSGGGFSGGGSGGGGGGSW